MKGFESKSVKKRAVTDKNIENARTTSSLNM
jgi:hypothetical protein